MLIALYPPLKDDNNLTTQYNAFSLGYLNFTLITKIIVIGITAIIVSVSDPMTKDAA